jgi:hypothetical protein
MRRSSPAGLPVALVASVAIHVAMAAFAFAPRAVAAPDPPPPDVWAGTSVELLTEIDLPAAPSGPSAPAATGAPGDAAEPPPPLPAAEPPAPEPPAAPPPKAAKPKEKAREPRSEKAPKEPAEVKEPGASRETKEAKDPKKDEKKTDESKAEPSKDHAPEEEPKVTRRTGHPIPASLRIPARVTPVRTISSAAEEAKDREAKGTKSPGASAAASAAPAGGSFGAVGATQVRDLGSSFTRAIAPAGQPDLTWGSLPVGDGGTLDVALDVDDEGKITGFTPKSAAPPAQLVGLVKRVLAVLRSGHFSIRGPAASAGVQVLRISARISDLVDPGLIQGGLVQLAFTFENGKGHSSFTQVTGRHVEVNVEVRKVEVAGAK